MVGILIGGLMPFIFSALSMGAVGRAAQAMVEEVRRQFREHPGIMDGTEQPDHTRAIAISTDSALREMIVPGLLAVGMPIFVGAVISAEALGRPADRLHRGRVHDGDHDGQRRRRLGQRQEVHRRGTLSAARAQRLIRPRLWATLWGTRSRTPPAPRSISC